MFYITSIVIRLRAHSDLFYHVLAEKAMESFRHFQKSGVFFEKS